MGRKTRNDEGIGPSGVFGDAYRSTMEAGKSMQLNKAQPTTATCVLRMIYGTLFG